MSKQKHDIGNKKRATATPGEKAHTTDQLAAELVRRGLASSKILDSRGAYSRPKERP